MFFRNLTLFRVIDFPLTSGQLEDLLAQHPLQPCTGLNPQSRGFVSANPNGAFVYAHGGNILFAVGFEKKVLPSAVVNQHVAERADEFEKQRGFKPGRKLMREIKDQVITELLPRAFAKQSSIRAWLYKDWLVVDTTSFARAEEVVSTLRNVMGSELKVELPVTGRTPSSMMTIWLSSGSPPNGFSLDDECELIGGDSTKATVRYVRHQLDGEVGLKRHIDDGKSVSKLALTWQDKLTFVVTDKMQVKRVKFGVGTGDDQIAKNVEEQFDSDFAIMAGTLSAVISNLYSALGGE